MARSDRPAPPRVSPALTPVDLADIDDGDLGESVSLSGRLSASFDQPLHLSNGRIDGASFVGAALVGSRLIDTIAHGCDFSGADLDGVALTRVEFRECRFAGARLSRARMRDVRFVDCQLDAVNLRHSQAEFVRFEQCRMVGAEFTSAKYIGVAWWDCNLTDADMSKISVTRGQLQGSVIDDLRGAMSLAPIAIDADQEPAFAALLLATLGIEVTDRLDG